MLLLLLLLLLLLWLLPIAVANKRIRAAVFVVVNAKFTSNIIFDNLLFKSWRGIIVCICGNAVSAFVVVGFIAVGGGVTVITCAAAIVVSLLVVVVLL